jgi:peptide chain release factor subunit 1
MQLASLYFLKRLSVLGAITSTQQKLKLYTRIPDNGLVIYCGTVMTDDGKERKLTIDFEPFKPINTSLYLCDNKFHTEALNELLEDDDTFGFIIMDGNGCLYGTLQGNTRAILHKFSVDLPKKHGRGGQSALRFARLRLEKRHNYVRKVAEIAVNMFIGSDNKVNVKGIVLAGSADFKSDLARDDNFDPRLLKAVIKTVDVSYGMDPGFNQAIELSAETLSNVKLVQEKKLLQQYYDEISQDTGKYCFMVEDTLKALDMSAVGTLIVWENLPVNRLVVKNTSTGEESVLHLTPDQEKNDAHFHDPETGVQLEITSRDSLVEYLAENYREWGADLQFITDRSQEGSQFCRGFGGIGGLLRWKIDFQDLEVAEEYVSGDDDDDFGDAFI